VAYARGGDNVATQARADDLNCFVWYFWQVWRKVTSY